MKSFSGAAGKGGARSARRIGPACQAKRPQHAPSQACGAPVGILAVQGDVEAHTRLLATLGAQARPVLRAQDLDDCRALVLPGGESTTIAKGLSRLQLWEPLRAFARRGLPMLGTCAGAILLAARVRHAPVPSLGLIDLCAVRNAYGTQVDSFAAPLEDAPPALRGFSGVFIRAPRFEDVGPRARVLATLHGAPVLVREANVWVAAFHPELTADPRLHALWLAREGLGAGAALLL